MAPAIAMQETTINSVCRANTVYPASIEAKFNRLLTTDRESAEFAELWAEVDAYLSLALAAERRV